MKNNKRKIVVCVPARNEAAYLPRLLSALASQTMTATIVIALNNTTDSSFEIVETFRSRNHRLDIVVDQVTFEPNKAHAGSARRRAMDVGLSHASPSGILITTDADARPPSDWIAANVAALDSGLDLVGGKICLDDEENIAAPIRELVARTDRYWAQVRAIEDSIDPVPWDPPPRHGDHTGASLALHAKDYIDSGGVPEISSGEDRALVNAVCLRGGKLGHPLSVWTRVSARAVGRAEAGMAEAMARLARASEIGTPVMLPHFRHWEQRSRWRRSIREEYGSAELWSREAEIDAMPNDMALTSERVFDSATA